MAEYQRPLLTRLPRRTQSAQLDSGYSGGAPPTTGYTHAVELSADEALAAGAARVSFSQPLPFYLEDLLEFPTGQVVPVGHYDSA